MESKPSGPINVPPPPPPPPSSPGEFASPKPLPPAAFTKPVGEGEASFGSSRVTTVDDDKALSSIDSTRSASFSVKSLGERSVKTATPSASLLTQPQRLTTNDDDDNENGDEEFLSASLPTSVGEGEYSAWSHNNRLSAASSTATVSAPDDDDDDEFLSPLSADASLAGTASSSAADNAETIAKTKETYQQHLEEYRDAHGKRWLLDNYDNILQALDNKKIAKQSPFKLYVVLNGQKHLLIPPENGLNKKSRKEAINYAKQQLAAMKQRLPTRDALSEKISAAEQPIANSYNNLRSLGVNNLLPPEQDVLSTGLRIDCVAGKPPKITAYYSADETSSSPSSDDDLGFSGLGLLTEPPALSDDEVSGLSPNLNYNENDDEDYFQ